MLTSIYNLVILFAIFFDFFLINIEVFVINITFLRIVVFLGTGYYIAKSLKSKKYIYEPSERIVFIFWCFWLIYSIIQVIWSVSSYDAIKGSYYILLYFSLYIVLSKSINHDNLFIVFKALKAISLYILLLGIIEIIFGEHLDSSRYVIEFKRYLTYNQHVATSVFYNENDFSYFINMITPLFLIRVFNNFKYEKLINYIFIVAGTAVIMINKSFISLAIQMGIFVVIFYLKFYNRIKKPVLKKVTIAIALAPVILSILYLIYMFTVQAFIKTEGSSYVRINLILNGLYLALKSSFLGVGGGGFESVINLPFDTGRISNPHNWYVELLANFGLPVFVFYLFIMINPIIKYIKNKRKTTLDNVIYGTAIIFLIGSIIPSRLFYFTFVWFFTALYLVYAYKINPQLN